jgi:hypothetical protein
MGTDLLPILFMCRRHTRRGVVIGGGGCTRTYSIGWWLGVEGGTMGEGGEGEVGYVTFGPPRSGSVIIFVIDPDPDPFSYQHSYSVK